MSPGPLSKRSNVQSMAIILERKITVGVSIIFQTIGTLEREIRTIEVQ